MQAVSLAFRLRARSPKNEMGAGAVRNGGRKEGSEAYRLSQPESQLLPKVISVASGIREVLSGVDWNPFGQGVAKHGPCTLNACGEGTSVNTPVDRGWTRIGHVNGHPTDSSRAPSK